MTEPTDDELVLWAAKQVFGEGATHHERAEVRKALAAPNVRLVWQHKMARETQHPPCEEAAQ